MRPGQAPDYMAQRAGGRERYSGLNRGDTVELHDASGAVLQVGPIRHLDDEWAGRIGAISSPGRNTLPWTLGREVRFRERNVFLVVR